MGSIVSEFYDYKNNNEKWENFESLIDEYNSTKQNIALINKMEITQEAKEQPVKELNKQVEDVKKRMHEYINTL